MSVEAGGHGADVAADGAGVTKEGVVLEVVLVLEEPGVQLPVAPLGSGGLGDLGGVVGDSLV